MLKLVEVCAGLNPLKIAKLPYLLVYKGLMNILPSDLIGDNPDRNYTDWLSF